MTVYVVLCDDGEYEANIDIVGVYSSQSQAEAVRAQWNERFADVLMSLEVRELDSIPSLPERPVRTIPLEPPMLRSTAVYPMDTQPYETQWIGGAQVLVLVPK